jgi:hypothetical protein
MLPAFGASNSLLNLALAGTYRPKFHTQTRSSVDLVCVMSSAPEWNAQTRAPENGTVPCQEAAAKNLGLGTGARLLPPTDLRKNPKYIIAL